jgi:hypothetical protein
MHAEMLGSRQQGSVATAVLLTIIALLLAGQTYMHAAEYMRRQAALEQVQQTIAELEAKRIAVFTDYMKDLDSRETKSVYHQIYHVNNAQLKMGNVLVQANQVLTALLAGKR